MGSGVPQSLFRSTRVKGPTCQRPDSPVLLTNVLRVREADGRHTASSVPEGSDEPPDVGGGGQLVRRAVQHEHRTHAL